MKPLYLFSSPPEWWTRLERLDAALRQTDAVGATDAYARVLNALACVGHADLRAAAADLFLYRSTPFSRSAMTGTVPEGLKGALGSDLAAMVDAVRRDWARDVQATTGQAQPSLEELAARPAGAERAIAEALSSEEPAAIARLLERHYRQHGDGPLARHLAFRWDGGAVVGIEHPSMPRMSRLVGLKRQLERISQNTMVFVADKPAQHALLYGPRGSGKSTAVRALLPRHHAEGLRLLEISPGDLAQLPDILELLRGRPHKYVLFVDDLTFEYGDAAYQPLKTLLEGSLTAPPSNTLVYATSNRRHLVRESLSDRPDPLDDDVHVWDTQHERLALADRFGLVITFPDASQRRFLEIVHGLVDDLEGAGSRHFALDVDARELEEKAIRFAEWGNGYSGRTAEQFVRTLRSRSEV